MPARPTARRRLSTSRPSFARTPCSANSGPKPSAGLRRTRIINPQRPAPRFSSAAIREQPVCGFSGTVKISNRSTEGKDAAST